MAHRNARLTPFARRLIVDRVHAGQPVAHVAKAMGVSRQCAHRWINRFDEAGDALCAPAAGAEGAWLEIEICDRAADLTITAADSNEETTTATVTLP